MTKLPGVPTWEPGYDEARLHLPDDIIGLSVTEILVVPKLINAKVFSSGIPKKIYFLLQKHGGINNLLSQYHDETRYIDRSLDDFFHAVLGVSQVEARKLTKRVMNNSYTCNDSDSDDEIRDDEITELNFD